MNERMNESLSALVDGEADELEIRRLLNQVDQDEELLERWSRYQMIGAVMRGEPASTIDLSRGIMQAIDGEPMDEVPGLPAASTTVASDTARRSLKWLSSGAVAASVAVAVLVGVRFTGSETEAPAQLASTVAPAQVTPQFSLPDGAEGSQLVSYNQSSALDEETLKQAQQRLREYVMQHNETAVLGSHGVMPFARVANFDQAGDAEQ